MTDFVEKVDYTINDKSTLNRFHVELNFAFDVSRYLQNDAFTIVIHDSMRHTDLKITAEDLLYDNSYGLVPIEDEEITEETKAKQINNSLIANDGLVIFFSGYKILTVIMIPVCTADNKTIGFYSSDINIQFTEDDSAEVKSIYLFANLFPKMIRSEILKQDDESIDDPVLERINIRPEYDFDKRIDKNLSRDFVYNSTKTNNRTKDYIYVNTTSKDYKDLEVPVYISTISAFGIDDKDKYLYAFEYDWKHANSYLVDESTNRKYDIEFAVASPVPYAFEPVPGYSSSIDTYLVTQYIYNENPGFYKNKLAFELNNIPNDILLERLVVEIVDFAPIRYNPEELTGTATITVYNPNSDYLDPTMLKYDFDGTVNMEADIGEIDWSLYETEGKVTIQVQNIQFTEESMAGKKARGKFVFGAWLDISDGSITPEQVKTSTYAFDIVATDYYTPAPELTQLTVEITGYTPDYGDNYIKVDEPETITVRITNNNTDYQSLTDYPLAWECTWNGVQVDASQITVDSSMYDSEHYIDLTIANLSANETDETYNFQVSAWINGQDLTVEPAITREIMKNDTINSDSIEFELFVENLQPLEFLLDTRVYDPVLRVDTKGNPVRLIKKYEEQAFTIDLYNPNFEYRDLTQYPISLSLVRGDDYFNDTTLSYVPDANYTDPGVDGGIIHVTVSGMKFEEMNIQKKVKIYACIDATIPHYSHEQVIADTETYYEDEDWWTMENPVIPYEWDFMKDCVIYTNSKLITQNSYIGVKTIRCAGAEFVYTNIASDIYCCGDLKIDNLNQNNQKTGYIPIDTQGTYVTSTGDANLNFENNTPLQYNVDGAPKLYYYYNPDGHIEYNSKFINANSSVIGNDPFAGYADDGGMIMRDEDYIVMDIPAFPVYPSDDTTANIQVNGQSSYIFDPEDPTYYDADKHIFRANEFTAGNGCTITFPAGEYHFKSWHCETQLTIIIPEFANDSDYVKIFVDEDIQISNSLKIINNNTNRLDEEGHLRCDSFLMYTRTGDITFAANNTTTGYDKQIGILVAPVGKITLSNTCIWKGSTWAKEILVQSNSEYHIL